MSKYNLLDEDKKPAQTYKYKRYMRDGSTEERTAVVRSRRNKKKENDKQQPTSSS